MRTNATITAWSKRTGNNAYGEPSFTAQTLTRPPAVLTEPRLKKVKLGDRELVSTLRAHVPLNPGIAAGDKVTIDSDEYTVAEVLTTTHATLGHDTLLLV
jgi:hypothetical protein